MIIRKKHCIGLIFLFLFNFLPLYAQDKKLTDFNGWEFLKWKISISEAEKILLEKNDKNMYVLLFKDTGYRTAFKYQDLYTYLYYDSLNQLSKVEQHMDFSVVEKEEADVYYKKTEEILVNKYGKPKKKTNDKTKEIITLIWNLKYTNITFTYDYKYKIIDEFGCCSYQVNIQFMQN
jgi:hypothetical protein